MPAKGLRRFSFDKSLRFKIQLDTLRPPFGLGAARKEGGGEVGEYPGSHLCLSESRWPEREDP